MSIATLDLERGVELFFPILLGKNPLFKKKKYLITL